MHPLSRARPLPAPRGRRDRFAGDLTDGAPKTGLLSLPSTAGKKPPPLETAGSHVMTIYATA
ncbi:MAG: hypothetical protein MPL62_02385 [Alphaproteobacteria bacterium]|nr:hypothetical protein [Alphaproteobacteria bacterium]